MITFITVFGIGLIVALVTGRKGEVQLTITGSDVMHPAEFELRDHYFMRCSD